MEAWEPLSKDELDIVWDKFDEEFDFKPSIEFKDFPGIKEPTPSITCHFDYPVSNEILDDLDNKTLNAFRSVVSPNDSVYALEWNSNCCWFRPHLPFEEWRIPIFPNGDYYIFLAKDFSFGIFGHPWEQTICIWGKKLLVEFQRNKPSLFEKVVRQN